MVKKLWLLIYLIFTVAASHSQDRPNVVFIMPDDISHSSFSYYGNSTPRTPNLDALAEQSLRLTDFHVAPTCAQTRASLMSGRYNAVVGVWHTIFQRNQLRADEITMADIFRHNGYATGLFWKWHLGDNYPFRPKDRGFDYVIWTKAGGVGQTADYWGNTNLSLTAWEQDKLVTMTDEDDGIEGAYSTNFFFNKAMKWMEEKHQEGKPFFAYIPTATAHSPFLRPPDSRGGISAKEAIVENIDKNIGRFLEFLEDKELAENTILIFTTDNGSGEKIYRGGKGDATDGGTRVPCFVRWPAGGYGGLKANDGREVMPLTAVIDWIPTFMDILEFEDVPGRSDNLKLHGMSFKNWLDSDPSNDPGTEYKNRKTVITNIRKENVHRTGRMSTKMDEWNGDEIIHKWRLIGTDQLYDVLADKMERNNLINNSAYSDIMDELRNYREDFWEEVELRSDEYTRIILGHPAEPETKLNCHDFHNINLHNHEYVAKGTTGSGFIAVELAKPGTYHFDLRRWPKEVEDQSTLRGAPSGKVYAGTTPVPIDISSARLRIWNGNDVYFDERKNISGNNADGIVFEVEDLPMGPAFVQTWFFDSDGDENGAVAYNYVRPQVVDTLGCTEPGNPNFDPNATVNNPEACATPVLPWMKGELRGVRLYHSHLEIKLEGKYSIKISDVLGRIHWDDTKKKPGTWALPQDLAPGMYRITIRQGGQFNSLPYLKL